MDALAVVGSLVVTEGSSAATLIPATVDVSSAPATGQPTYSLEQQQAVDTVFASPSSPTAPPLVLTFIVATGCVVALEGVIRESSSREEEDDETQPIEEDDLKPPDAR